MTLRTRETSGRTAKPVAALSSVMTAWPTLVAAVLVYDLINAISCALFWVEIGELGDGRVLFVMEVVRLAISSLFVLVALHPARVGMANPSGAETRELLQAERTLRTRRHWIVAVLMVANGGAVFASLILAWAGLPVAKPIGAHEVLTGVLIVVGASAAFGPFMSTLIRGLSDPIRLKLGAELSRRGIELERESGGIVRSTLALQVGSTLGIVIGMIAVGGVIRGEALRDAQVARQQHRAHVVALQFEERQFEGLEFGVEILDEEALEGANWAEGLLEGAEFGGARDAQSGELVGVAALDEGRWVVVRSEVDMDVEAYLMVALLLPAMIAGVFLTASLLQSWSIVTKLRALGELTRRVVEHGQIHDLERPLVIADNEVGRLEHDFNAMLDVFEELVSAAARVSTGDLCVVLDGPGELHEAFRQMVEQLAEIVTEIQATAIELATTAGQLDEIVGTQLSVAQRQSASAAEAGTTANSLADAAGRIAEAGEQVHGDAEQALETTASVATKLVGLSAEAEGVGELLERIREVAGRSDLLALNGSLEATRAGEAGRGFGLVAAEMRRLAERVHQTVTDVHTRVVAINQATEGTVAATEQSRALAQRTVMATQAIQTLTTRQSIDAGHVAAVVEDVASDAVQTASATAQTRTAASQLATQAKRLQQLTDHFELRPERDRQSRS